MIDLHCHLDLFPNPSRVVASCIERGLYVLSVTTVPSAFNGTQLLAGNNRRIKTALGLHPQLAASRIQEMPLFESLLKRTRYVGEIGLDGSREHRGTLDAQRGILKDILKLCATAGGKILSLHSRGATADVLKILHAEPTAGTPILHWYVGTANQVSQAAEIGCWFSVGPAMLSSKNGRAAVSKMPHDRILPESDGPFGVVNGQPVYPWEAWRTAAMLAEICNEDVADVEHRLITNFRTVVRSVPGDSEEEIKT